MLSDSSSLNQKLIILAIILIIIYFLWKPEYINNMKNYLGSFFSMEKFTTEKEISDNSYQLPDINQKDISLLTQFVNEVKDTNILEADQPSMDTYNKLSMSDHQNIMSYISNKLKANVYDHSVQIINVDINPNIFYSFNSNILFLTPLETIGDLVIDGNVVGQLHFNIFLQGTTNSLYVPKEGFFIGDKKFNGFIKDLKIIKATDINKEQTGDNLINKTWTSMVRAPNYSVTNPNNPPVQKYSDLENDEDINFSEIIEDDYEQQSEILNSEMVNDIIS